MSRITWIEVNLDAVAHNLRAIKKKIGKGIKIMAIVKADAYGHGAVEVSRVLVKNGIDMLGVAFPEEGVELKEKGIDIPVLILNPIMPEQIEDALRNSLRVTVCNLSIAEKLSKMAKKHCLSIKVHVEIDTGMGGAGVHPDETLSFIRSLLLIENLEIEGIFTHFHSSDESDKSFTDEQNKNFEKVLKKLDDEGINIPLKHAANSAAILDFSDSYFNMVRPGLILYGIFPSIYASKEIDLKQVMTFKTKVINIKDFSSGQTIGYGRTFKVTKETTVATIPVGYKDGFSRYLSSKGKVLINGKFASIIGRVCMDRFFVDVTNLSDVEVGSEVVLYGSQKGASISIESVAERIGTIPHEVVCNVGANVPKKKC
mgnify:CR=1 FL=1|jgi:alanine racemase